MSVDFLLSYHYAHNNENLLHAAIAPGMHTICDSGAFSAASTGATITLREYATWLREWGHRFLWCASLDVIGDPQASYENWAALHDRWGLTTVPTVHFGTDPSWLNIYHQRGATLIGLGGMVGKPVSKLRPWLVACFQTGRRLPGVGFHGWGFAHAATLAALPFYSVDSSGPIASSYRFGQLTLFDTQQHRNVVVGLNGRAAWRHADLLRDQYGVDPEVVATSHVGNRMLLARLAMRSIQQHAAWLRQRHQVVAPACLGTGAAAGTRIHAVDVSHNVPGELARFAAEQLATNHTKGTH